MGLLGSRTRVGGDPCQRQATESSLAASTPAGSKRSARRPRRPGRPLERWRAHRRSARSPDRRTAQDRLPTLGMSAEAGRWPRAPLVCGRGCRGALGEVPNGRPAVPNQRAPRQPQSPLVTIVCVTARQSSGGVVEFLSAVNPPVEGRGGRGGPQPAGRSRWCSDLSRRAAARWARVEPAGHGPGQSCSPSRPGRAGWGSASQAIRLQDLR